MRRSSFELRRVHLYQKQRFNILWFDCFGKNRKSEFYTNNIHKLILFLFFKKHGNPMLLKLDTNGDSDEYRSAINNRPSSIQYGNNQNACHECSKLDLRAKVETSQSYNQFVVYSYLIFAYLINN